MVCDSLDDSYIRISLFLNDGCAKFLQRESFVCRLLEDGTSTDIGIFQFKTISRPDFLDTKPSNVSGMKRQSSYVGHKKVVKRFCGSNVAGNEDSLVRKDVHTALKDLNLMPNIGTSDLACSMCPYVATQKSNLKIHYKLKHLGGADVIFDCSICSAKIKTKSNLKTHYRGKHKLGEDAVQRLMP